MKNIRSILLFTVCASLSWSKIAIIDHIAATVDGEIILHSEVLTLAQQLKSTPTFSALTSNELNAKVLNQLIDSKVLLAKAKKDTLKLTETELTERVENHIQMLMQQQRMNQEQMEKALIAQMGMNLTQFKAKLNDQMREQSLQQKVRGKYANGINPTPKDVQAFFSEYKDSLPKQFDTWKISHIQMKIAPLAQQKDSVRKIADSLITRLDKGENFDRLAEKYSQDLVSKNNGGDLGFIKKGTLEPEFERVAFWLEQGQYGSFPVSTQLGWHIVKVLAKKDSEVRPAHILLAVQPTQLDTMRAKVFLDSLKKDLVAGTSFAAAATQYSDDKKSNKNQGVLGWFSKREIDPQYASIVTSLAVNKISEPVLIDGSWHLFKVDDKKEERDLTLAEDWDKIQNICTNVLSDRKIQDLLKKWRSEFQVNIRHFKDSEVFPEK